MRRTINKKNNDNELTKVIVRENWNDTFKNSVAPGTRMTRINREVLLVSIFFSVVGTEGHAS